MATVAKKLEVEVPEVPKNIVPEERVAAPRKKGIVVKAAPKPKPKVLPDLVWVRAIEKGQYGVERDQIVRNPGEVFEMATTAMRRWPLEAGEHPTEHPVVIDVETEDGVPKGQFELPGWVELVDDIDSVPKEALESRGLPSKWRGQVSGEGRNMDIQ